MGASETGCLEVALEKAEVVPTVMALAVRRVEAKVEVVEPVASKQVGKAVKAAERVALERVAVGRSEADRASEARGEAALKADATEAAKGAAAKEMTTTAVQLAVVVATVAKQAAVAAMVAEWAAAAAMAVLTVTPLEKVRAKPTAERQHSTPRGRASRHLPEMR